ncbi:hypothetical protein [Limnospira fusiformis]|uniref:hypothetical protein n=1 Tax=Limnospira fusiformis TaxID=54297 RepID=UPI0034E0BFCC
MKTRKYNKVGNPNFSTDKNPSKLTMEGPVPLSATYSIKVDEDLCQQLRAIPRKEMRDILANVVKDYQSPATRSAK